MKYRCIKELSIPILDENWYEETGEYIVVKVGQIWTRDDETNIIGSDVHLDNDTQWIEISNETLKEYFELGRMTIEEVIEIIKCMIGTRKGRRKRMTDKISKKELLEIIHDIYAQNLYCMEDYCEKDEKGYDCKDCLYNAIVRSIKERR